MAEIIKVQVSVAKAKHPELHEFLSKIPEGGLAEVARKALLFYMEHKKGRRKKEQPMGNVFPDAGITSAQAQQLFMQMFQQVIAQGAQTAFAAPSNSIIVPVHPSPEVKNLARPTTNNPLSAQDQIPPPPEDEAGELDSDALAALDEQSNMF